MSDQPWRGDAVSLVEAFRAGERSPVEELEATLAAIEGSDLNAVCHLDVDAARAAAASADVQLPFGGVPFGVKELDHVAGWPATEASVPLAEQIADYTDTKVQRIIDAGAIPVAQTTSSEFGGTNQTFTKLHGATRNPWNLDRTPGGSSGGSSAGVAGGLFTIATGSDGGGSIRIPAGFCGLVGLKPTWGRIPRGPKAGPSNLTAVSGCMSRSVRDSARWFDVANGFDARDPLSLPRVDGWEAGLGTLGDELTGARATIEPEFGRSVVADETIELVVEAATWLIGVAGLRQVDTDAALPNTGGAWGVTGSLGLKQALGDRWPACAADLTGPMRAGLSRSEKAYNMATAVRAEEVRIELNEAMADLFEQTTFVFAATNPDVAFGADSFLPTTFGGKEGPGMNHGALTIPANIYGNPGISVPIGLSSDGLPVGLQIMGPHHSEPLLLELALLVERERPWPLVAP